MAERAGDAVGGEVRIGSLGASDRQVGEDLAGASLLQCGDGGHGHVAARALALDLGGGRGIVHDLAPHGRVEVGVAGGVGHHRGAPVEADRHVDAAGSHHVLVARDATVGGPEGVGGIRQFGRVGRDGGTRPRRVAKP